MEQHETSNNLKHTGNAQKKYVMVAVLCFLFGGFSMVLYLMQIYSSVWRADMVNSMPVQRENVTNSTFQYALRGRNRSFAYEDAMRSDPYLLLFSPSAIISLINGFVSLLAGFSILGLIREKELKDTKKKMLDIFLMPEEKIMILELEKNGGSATQIELSKSTGFSRVKVHRIVAHLEKKNLIMKQPYGMTNKIMLKKW